MPCNRFFITAMYSSFPQWIACVVARYRHELMASFFLENSADEDMDFEEEFEGGDEFEDEEA